MLIFSPALRDFSSNPFHLPQKPTPYRLPHAKQPYFQRTPAPRRSAPLRSKRPNARKRPTYKTSPCVAKSSSRADSRLPETVIDPFPVLSASALQFLAFLPISTDANRNLSLPRTLEIAPRSQTTPREKLTEPNLPDTLKLPNYSPYAKGIVQKVENRDE